MDAKYPISSYSLIVISHVMKSSCSKYRLTINIYLKINTVYFQMRFKKMIDLKIMILQHCITAGHRDILHLKERKWYRQYCRKDLQKRKWLPCVLYVYPQSQNECSIYRTKINTAYFIEICSVAICVAAPMLLFLAACCMNVWMQTQWSSFPWFYLVLHKQLRVVAYSCLMELPH